MTCQIDADTRFTGNFTRQAPIPAAGIAAALRGPRHGRLHRYRAVAGEVSETTLLEQAFAAATGAKYCLAVALGEGGLLVTDDAALMPRAIMLSGSDRHYDRHMAGPPPETFAISGATRRIVPAAWTICAPPSRGCGRRP